MHRVTAGVLPRLAACAVCVSAVVAQRRSSSSRVSKGSDMPGPTTTQKQPGRPAATRAAATLAPAAQALFAAPVLSGSPATTPLVRTLVQVVRNLWLSVALGAAVSWATISARMVSTVKQLQVGAPAKIAEAPVLDVAAVKQFCGHWAKVGARCDSMDSFCELFGVPKWLRQATRLMGGMQISITDDTLIIKQVCKLSWLSAVETFPLDGSCSRPHKRRDMRSGKQTGRLLEACNNSMTVSVCWQGTLPGSAVDRLQLQDTPQGTLLLVFHKAQVEGRGTAEFKEVFRLSS